MKDSLCLRSWKVNRTTPAEDSSDSSNNFKRSAIFKNDSHKCRRKILANWTYLSPAGPKQDWTYLNLGQIITLNFSVSAAITVHICIVPFFFAHVALDQTTGSKQWWEDYEVKDWNHLFYLSDPFTLCVVCKRPSLWNLSNFNCHSPSPVSLFFCHSSGWAKYQGQCNSSTTVLDPPRCSYGGLCHTFLAWQSAVLNPPRFSYVGLCHTLLAHHLLNRAATSIDPCFKKLR